MESSLIKTKCSFCCEEYSVQLPLKERINIDCDCGAWGYVDEQYNEYLYFADLQKVFGVYLATLPTNIVNNGLYSCEYINVSIFFDEVDNSCFIDGNPIYYKWIKKKIG